MTQPLDQYLREVNGVRATRGGVNETSYYAALANLFNQVGAGLRPRVLCVMQLANLGAGHPDGGFFTSDQLQRGTQAKGLAAVTPARGVIEVKGTREDAFVTAGGTQVTRYWGTYRQVLVTNLRDFVLVGQDADGNAVKLETFRLAPDETAFWALAARPQTLGEETHRRFEEYLRRVLLQAAPVDAPQDLANLIAAYAREALLRVEAAKLGNLETVRQALEEALGMTFQGEEGDHFFRSTLVQTLFYGVFSAWVLWARMRPAGSTQRFNWHDTPWLLRLPIIGAIFQQVATPAFLGLLDLVQVLDWTEGVLNRVNHDVFFQRFQQENAVQYFYEPFLQAFDPVLRKQLGIWFTPPEIVRYMVARVDTALREELGIADGLADPSVYVLDPCTGTGSYLVEVLRSMHRTLLAKGEGALAAGDVKRAAMERVFGFEILPAPFVVAHLQLGVLMQALGAPFSEPQQERAGVFLTNALTGWEPPRGPKQHLLFPELEQERDAAERVKQRVPVLVVLGNPPYNGFAGVAPAEEQGSVDVYKEGLATTWKVRKYNLDDLYVRFLRLAERRIAEGTGRGVVCYISNFSYLGDASFVVLRQRFLQEFDALWLDSLNGDSRETGKRTPDGQPDPSAFSTEYNPAGIRVGTSVGTFVRKGQRAAAPIVRYRDLWGATKRADLLASLQAPDFDSQYRLVEPSAASRFSFRAATTAADYRDWPKIVDLCAQAPISGLQEMRKGALMGIDRAPLEARMGAYFDTSLGWDGFAALGSGLSEKAGRFDPSATRPRLQAAEAYDSARIERYALYPFDNRWAYYSSVRPLWNEPRAALKAQQLPNNLFVVTRMAAERPTENVAITATRLLPDYHLLRPNVVAIPVLVRPEGQVDALQHKLFGTSQAQDRPRANLSALARQYLAGMGLPDPDADHAVAALVWLHALAIGHAPAYTQDNAEELRRDWPRIPLPPTADLLRASAELGGQVLALLDTEVLVPGIESGPVREELRVLAVVTKLGGGALDSHAGDMDVTAGWGHGGDGEVVMPGAGHIERRAYTGEERAHMIAGAAALGLTEAETFDLLEPDTCDVYLNHVAYWSNVPSALWDFRIGGYQVLKKWLSYREKSVLGRSVTQDEVRYFRDMVRRLAVLLLLGPTLDANYRASAQHAT